VDENRDFLRQLSAELRITRQAIDKVRKAVEQASQGRALMVALNLTKIRDQIGSLHHGTARLGAIEPRAIESALQDAIAEARLRVERDFEEAVRSKGWALSGQWPSYTVEHLIKVKFDANEQRTLVGVTPFRSLHLEAPFNYLAGLVEGIRTRQFDPADFVPALSAAYRAAIEAKHRKAGDVVPILDIYKRMQRGRAYRPELFGIDLSRAIRSADTTPIRLSPARSPRGAIYVPDSRGGTFVSGLGMAQPN
jgi:hypothetical protein